MSFDIGHIIASMSPLSKAIALVLVVMAVLSIGVAVERWLAFARSAKDSKSFAAAAGPLIDEWKVDELVKVAGEHSHSPLAKLFGAISARYLRASTEGAGGLSPVELSRNEAERQKEKVGVELRRGLDILATVGSIAPFVGLLGTVIGIIAAFQGIGAQGSGGIAAVSTGIAEALVETAFGLMVAIPAVILFNYLSAGVTNMEIALSRSVGELLDEMEDHHGRGDAKRKKAAA